MGSSSSHKVLSQENDVIELEEYLNKSWNFVEEHLNRSWNFVEQILQILQTARSSSVQPVVTNAAKDSNPDTNEASVSVSDVLNVSIIDAITELLTESAGIKEPASTNLNTSEAPSSRSDVCEVPNNDVMAQLQTKLESYKKDVMKSFNSIRPNLTSHRNQMKDVRKSRTPEPPKEPKRTEVKKSQTDQQRMIPILEEGRKVIVQIYYSENATLPEDIIPSLYELLRRDISNKYGDVVTLTICTYHTTEGINCRLPLIVLCPVASRIGTSVDDALKGVHTDENVILLMLHHVARHEMNILSTTRKLTLPELTKLGPILDMVFHSKVGIHKCKQNDDTVDRIAEFLLQYMSK